MNSDSRDGRGRTSEPWNPPTPFAKGEQADMGENERRRSARIGISERYTSRFARYSNDLIYKTAGVSPSSAQIYTPSTRNK